MKSTRIGEIVRELKSGNFEHYNELYMGTYSKALATARKYLKNEYDQQDVVQEAVMAAINNINGLRKEESYQPWLNQIVATRALNLLRRKNPLAFSEMSPDEENDFVSSLEDEDASVRPDETMDMAATSEAVEEVMNMLPEFQRDALWAVYGQKIPVRSVAEALGVSENTVKSRLKQGRDKLKSDRMKMEFRRRGVEVTGVSVAVLLSGAFTYGISADAATIAASPFYAKTAAKMLGEAVNYINTASSAGAAAGTGATAARAAAGAVGSAAGKGIGSKVAIGVLTAALVASTFVGYRTIGADHGIDWNINGSPSVEEPLVSRGSDRQTGDAIEAYRSILDEAPSMDAFEDGYTPSGNYQYALVTMKDGEGPTLLLSQDEEPADELDEEFTGFSSKLVRLYYYDPETGETHSSSDSIWTGYRMQNADDFSDNEYEDDDSNLIWTMSMEPDGNGIRMERWSEFDGEISQKRIYRYVRDGSDLVREKEESGDSDTRAADIIWHELNDTSAMDQWKNKGKKGDTADEKYAEILSQAASMKPFDSSYTTTGWYKYSLVTMKNSEGPSLLLSQSVVNGDSDGVVGELVKLYYYDQNKRKMYVTDNYMQSGSFGSYSYTTGLYENYKENDLVKNPDGEGILMFSSSSEDGVYDPSDSSLQTEMYLCTRKGDHLNIEKQSADSGDGTDSFEPILWSQLCGK